VLHHQNRDQINCSQRLDDYSSAELFERCILMDQIPAHLLRPAEIREIRLDVTTRCNLRCVYCAVSQTTYEGHDMPRGLMECATDYIKKLAKYHSFGSIGVNGHGETTIAAGWVNILSDFLQQGLELDITTNLAREYTATEFDVLSRMRSIAVSIDTADRILLRRTRRKVDVRQIVMNIQLIRAAALRMLCKPPTFTFLAGLYDKNSMLVEDFARLSIALGIHTVQFWNLNKYPYENTDVAPEDRVLPLDDLPDDELRPRVEAVYRAIELLRRNRIVVNVAGGFVDVLARRVGINV
jgi:MoaA/NifB/PqqE/SkfB family radical SAM enzyme